MFGQHINQHTIDLIILSLTLISLFKKNFFLIYYGNKINVVFKEIDY